jgi:AcrR family transcriptional regulator
MSDFGNSVDDPLEPHSGKELRSQRTRRRIVDAYLELATMRDLNDIDVQDVTVAAGLNRSTYYLHFSSREVLREEVISMLIREVTAGGDALLESAHPDLDRMRSDWHDTLFTRIAGRPMLFGRLLGQSGPGSFSEELRGHHERALLILWSHMHYTQSPSGAPLTIWARFTAEGLNGMIRLWVDTGMRESPEALSRWIWNLCFPSHLLPIAST